MLFPLPQEISLDAFVFFLLAARVLTPSAFSASFAASRAAWASIKARRKWVRSISAAWASRLASATLVPEVGAWAGFGLNELLAWGSAEGDREAVVAVDDDDSERQIDKLFVGELGIGALKHLVRYPALGD